MRFSSRRTLALTLLATTLLLPTLTFAYFSQDLRQGDRGQAVVELQQFLIERGLLAEGNDTGNFLGLTLAAVKRFQEEQNIEPVSGFFGPLTRAAANRLLDQAAAPRCPQVAIPSCQGGILTPLGTDQRGCSLGFRCSQTQQTTPLTGTLTISPQSGTAPFTPQVRYSASIQGTYVIDFGDTTSITVNASPGETSINHTYERAGTYATMLYKSVPSCDSCTDQNGRRLLASAAVSVQSPTPRGDLHASPTTGRSPLMVYFMGDNLTASTTAYTINFGDGTEGGLSATASTTHRYTIPGTYHATLRAQGTVLNQETITVQQGGCTGTGCVQTNACKALDLRRILKRGMSGPDVASLQDYLAEDPAIYPEALSTGYYGAATERAVQRWQAAQGIVSGGEPEETGYGVIGPRTIKAMREACSLAPLPTNPTASTTAATHLTLSVGQIAFIGGVNVKLDSIEEGSATFVEIPTGADYVTYYFSSPVILKPNEQAFFGSATLILESVNQVSQKVTVGVVAGQGCTLDGATVTQGQSKVFYSARTASDANACAAIAETRTCTNGTLSGSSTFQYASCTTGAGSCTYNEQTFNVDSPSACVNGYCACVVGGQPFVPNRDQARAICQQRGFEDVVAFQTKNGRGGVRHCSADGSGCFTNAYNGNLTCTSVTCSKGGARCVPDTVTTPGTSTSCVGYGGKTYPHGSTVPSLCDTILNAMVHNLCPNTKDPTKFSMLCQNGSWVFVQPPQGSCYTKARELIPDGGSVGGITCRGGEWVTQNSNPNTSCTFTNTPVGQYCGGLCHGQAGNGPVDSWSTVCQFAL